MKPEATSDAGGPVDRIVMCDLSNAVSFAMINLPADYKMEIAIEAGMAWVRISYHDPLSGHKEIAFHEEGSLCEQIYRAIQVAKD